MRAVKDGLAAPFVDGLSEDVILGRLALLLVEGEHSEGPRSTRTIEDQPGCLLDGLRDKSLTSY